MADNLAFSDEWDALTLHPVLTAEEMARIDAQVEEEEAAGEYVDNRSPERRALDDYESEGDTLVASFVIGFQRQMKLLYLDAPEAVLLNEIRIHCVTLHQFRDSGTVRRNEVTRAIFDKMPGWEGSGDLQVYDSRAEAEAAISEGAIRFALNLPRRNPRQVGGELATDGMDGLGSLGYFFRDSGNSG